MPIKFLYPDQSKKDIVEELNKIVENLQKKPDPVLENNARFIKSFTKAMFITAAKQKKKEQTNFSRLPIHLITQTKKIKEKKLEPLPPPPPPSPPSTSSSFKKENNILVYTKLEPQMSNNDMELYNLIIPQIQSNPEINQDELINKTAATLNLQVSQPYINKIKYYLEKNLRKYNILTPLIEEPRISDISIKSFDSILVKYDNEFIPVNIKFNSKQDLFDFQTVLLMKYSNQLKEESQINIRLPNLIITGVYSKKYPNLRIIKQ